MNLEYLVSGKTTRAENFRWGATPEKAGTLEFQRGDLPGDGLDTCCGCRGTRCSGPCPGEAQRRFEVKRVREWISHTSQDIQRRQCVPLMAMSGIELGGTGCFWQRCVWKGMKSGCSKQHRQSGNDRSAHAGFMSKEKGPQSSHRGEGKIIYRVGDEWGLCEAFGVGFKATERSHQKFRNLTDKRKGFVLSKRPGF